MFQKAQVYQPFDAYEKAEEKSNLLAVWFPSFIFWSFTIGVFMVSFALSFYEMYVGNYDTSTWFIPFYYYNVLPFDATTVSGWYIEFVLQICGGYPYVVSRL